MPQYGTFPCNLHSFLGSILLRQPKMACNNSNKISDLILFLTGNPRACRVQVVHKGGTHMATATMSRIDELRDLQGRARHIDVRNETAFQEILRDARSEERRV